MKKPKSLKRGVTFPMDEETDREDENLFVKHNLKKSKTIDFHQLNKIHTEGHQLHLHDDLADKKAAMEFD